MTPGARRRPALLAPVLVAVAPILVLAGRILVERPRIFFWGDQALSDIAAGRAVTGHELVGPYSRYGWHHPGPVWFFLVGVVRFAGGGSPVATMLGVLAVHAVFAGLVVAVGHRLAGRAGAWVAAFACLGVLQTLGLVERVAYLWNPWAIVLPALLLIGLSILLADPAQPALPVLVAVALCASFLVQTHAGTLLFIVLVPAAGLALRVTDVLQPPWARVVADDDERPKPVRRLSPRARLFVGIGAAAALLVWTPPVVQQLTHDPGNLGQLASYVRGSHEKSTVESATTAVGTELAAFPFLKDTDRLFQEADADAFDRRTPFRLVPFVSIAAALAVALVAVRRANRLAATCALVGAAGVVAGLLTSGLTSPPLYPYLVAWMVVLPVPIWVSLIVLVGGRVARQVPRAGLAGLVVIGVVSAACVYQAGHDRHLRQHLAFTGGQESWRLVKEPVLAHHGPLLLHLADGGAMPVAASIADQVYRRGRSFSVNDDFVSMFGDRARSHGGETLELYFAGVHQTGDDPPPAGAVDLGVVRDTHVWLVQPPVATP